ncbi:MAG TPA: PD-(D/E)XK nuclease family protein, partial [Thermoleophilia bacterium]|nr:PD-(D/E)XK nuclease family protein [Thermoleophilia bacterium]
DTSLHGYLHAAHVESIRASAASSSYAGTLSPHVGQEVRRLYDGEHEYSATELERYVRCPFRFFAEYLLHLAEPDEPEEDIPAHDKGTLLHQIFYEFYARRLREHADARIGDDEILAAYRVLAELAQGQCKDEPYTGLLWDKFCERLVGAGDDVPGLLRRFLDVEVETTRGPAACTPRHLELGFGHQRHRQTLDPASRGEPVAIQAGERTIRLHGVIDRIDLNDETGTYCVLDYKSGSRVPSQKEIESGVSLQLPIYMLAARDLLGKEKHFAAAGFFQTKDAANCEKKGFVGHRELGPQAIVRNWSRSFVLDDFGLGEFLRRECEMIGKAVEGIESARFAVTSLGPDVAGCGACHYKHLCRYEGITIRTLQER